MRESSAATYCDHSARSLIFFGAGAEVVDVDFGLCNLLKLLGSLGMLFWRLLRLFLFCRVDNGTRLELWLWLG